MKTEGAVTTSWEDLLFENRNKDYGAYFLRKIYSRNVVMASLGMTVIMGLVFAYPSISRSALANLIKDRGKVVKLDQPPPIMPNTPPPPKVDVPPPPVKTLKYVAPKVFKEEVVEEELPTIDEIKRAEVSTEISEGQDVVFEEPVKAVVETDDKKIYTLVEQQPEFPGGMEAMMKFIQKNMKYPAQARRMGTEGRVFIGFVVNGDGQITDVTTVKGISMECDQEATRVIQMMPPWKAGKQNGRAVRVRFVLPVNFKLAD